jgi:hypothetical protein
MLFLGEGIEPGLAELGFLLLLPPIRIYFRRFPLDFRGEI